MSQVTMKNDDVCELCHYEKKTTYYGETKSFRAFKCLSCKGIVIAHKAHVEKISFTEWKELSFFMQNNFGEHFEIRTNQRKIRDHFHIHVYLPFDIDKKCVLCGKKIIGPGNNPEPLAKEGRCCDSCNYLKVIPARFGNLH